VEKGSQWMFLDILCMLLPLLSLNAKHSKGRSWISTLVPAQPVLGFFKLYKP
jgi:hypothetical protein